MCKVLIWLTIAEHVHNNITFNAYLINKMLDVIKETTHGKFGQNIQYNGTIQAICLVLQCLRLQMQASSCCILPSINQIRLQAIRAYCMGKTFHPCRPWLAEVGQSFLKLSKCWSIDRRIVSIFKRLC